MPSLFTGLLFLAANIQPSAEDRVADYTMWLTIFTAVLAAVSIVQICFLLRSDKTARISSEAAKKSAEIAEAALVAGTRAIVSVSGLTSFWELGAEGTLNWRFRPQWRNAGKTPTKNMRLYSECELRNSLLPHGFDFSNNIASPGPGHLGPDAQALGGLAPRDAPITPQDILDAEANRKFIYLWGWARYYDVFPNTPEHVTAFCWRILPFGNPLSAEAKTDMKFSNVIHDEGNHAS